MLGLDPPKTSLGHDVSEAVPELSPPPPVLFPPPPVVFDASPEGAVIFIVSVKSSEHSPSDADVVSVITSPAAMSELLKFTLTTDPLRVASPAEEGLSCPIVKVN